MASEDSSLTPKQEAFCHAYIANGGNASAAYREAYDAEDMKAESVGVAAHRLTTHPKVALKIKELRDDISYKHNLSLAELIKELEEARILASTCETPQTSAMVAATMGKAKMLGYDRQKVEVSGHNGGPIQSESSIDFTPADAYKALINGN